MDQSDSLGLDNYLENLDPSNVKFGNNNYFQDMKSRINTSLPDRYRKRDQSREIIRRSYNNTALQSIDHNSDYISTAKPNRRNINKSIVSTTEATNDFNIKRIA